MNKEEELLQRSLESKYDCDINLRRGVSSKSGEDNKHYLEIGLSSCNNQFEDPQFFSSLIAYDAYKTIENNIYPFLRVKISDNLYEYKTSDLKEVSLAEEYFHDVFNLLKTGDYNRVSKDLWAEIKKDDYIERFNTNLDSISYKFNFANLKLNGFMFIKQSDAGNGIDTDLLRLKGLFGKDSIHQHTFELFIPKKFEKTIYGINLEE